MSTQGAKAMDMDFVDMNPPTGFEQPAGFGPEFEAAQQAAPGSILARNKSERRRKQRLEAEPDNRLSQSYTKPMTLAQKVDAWMINEGKFLDLSVLQLTFRWTQDICHCLCCSTFTSIRAWISQLSSQRQFDPSTGDLWRHLCYREGCSISLAH